MAESMSAASGVCLGRRTHCQLLAESVWGGGVTVSGQRSLFGAAESLSAASGVCLGRRTHTTGGAAARRRIASLMSCLKCIAERARHGVGAAAAKRPARDVRGSTNRDRDPVFIHRHSGRKEYMRCAVPVERWTLVRSDCSDLVQSWGGTDAGQPGL